MRGKTKKTSHVHTRSNQDTHRNNNEDIDTHINMNVNINMNLSKYRSQYRCKYISKSEFGHRYKHTHTHTYTHIYIYLYIHIFLHMHTQTLGDSLQFSVLDLLRGFDQRFDRCDGHRPLHGDSSLSVSVVCFVHLISANGSLLVWVGGLDSWNPLMKGIATWVYR